MIGHQRPPDLGDIPYCERHGCWHAYPKGEAGCAAYDRATAQAQATGGDR